MTRRIALAILLTVWATLVVAGTSTYLTTRVLLLADLDARTAHAALDRPSVVPGQKLRASAGFALPEESRYRVATGPGQATAGPLTAADVPSAFEARIANAYFSRQADGTRMRTVALEALVQPARAGAESVAGTVIESGDAEPFHHQLNQLAFTLIASGLIGGLLAAGLAIRASRVALRPLSSTAAAIAAIDERKLDDRIDVDGLPAELVPVGERLNGMLERLAQAFALRHRFLADASHELRTPVAALVTRIEVTLARPRDADAYRRAMTDALAEATHLRRLVEGLMEHVRSQSFTHDEPIREVDVAEVIAGCADLAAPLAAARGVEFRRPAIPPILVRTQPGRIRGIVQNLLSNAIEYNRGGGWVELRVCARDGALEIEVRDGGPGIAPEQLPRLFEPFHRGDAARGVTEQGHLGLGLALVKAHADAMGGRCDVESVVGRGSTFRVALPAAAERARRDEPPKIVTRPAGPFPPARGRAGVVSRALIGLLAMAVMTASPGVVHAGGKQPKKTDGAYTATVRGFHKGKGSAEVKGPGKKVKIAADVETEDGRKGQLSAPNLKLDGAHFSGSGKVMGVDAEFTGRLDGYADDKTFAGARLLCTYVDADGHVGRVVGVIE